MKTKAKDSYRADDLRSSARTTRPVANDGIKFELRGQFQRDIIKTIRRNHISALIGSAGTGKTLLAAYAGIQLLQAGEVDKIAITRLARESHFENIGALPGEISDKLGFISAPVYDNFSLFMHPQAISKLEGDGKIELMPVSYMRGRSLHRTFLIVEEAQNMPRDVIVTILTRIAEGSKIVFTGDPMQEDFANHRSCDWLTKLITGVEGCAAVQMPRGEIFRHPVIPEILANVEKYRQQ